MRFAHKLVQDCLRYTCAKYYPSVLIFDKVITKIKRFHFFKCSIPHITTYKLQFINHGY